MKATGQFGLGRRGVILGAAAFPLIVPRARAQAPKNVTYVQPNPSAVNSFQVFVAIGEGYFRDEGLNVRVETVDGSAPVIQALAAGRAEIGRPGPAPVLRARARGVDVVFIFNSLPRSSFGILVKGNAAYRDPTQLRGKAIGVGTRDGAEVGFARSILTDLGMQENRDYTFIPVGDGGPAAAGFLRGDIEAYVGATSDAAILNFRGVPVRDITPEKYSTYFGNGFATMGDIIRRDPAMIEGFGRALVRASHFTMNPDNRPRALQHMSAGNPQEGENRRFAEALLNAVLAKAQPIDPAKGWGYQDPAHWEAWQRSLVESKEMERALPDLEAAYTNRFVEAWNRPR